MTEYAQISRFYDQLNAGNNYSGNCQYILEKAARHGIDVETIVDAGTGTGGHALEFAEMGYQVVAYDIEPGMIAVLEDEITRRHLQHRLTTIVADMQAFICSPQADLVTCMTDTINHFMSVADLERVFKHVRDSLKVGGLFAFDTNTLGEFQLNYSSQRVFRVSDSRTIVWDGHGAPDMPTGGSASVTLSCIDTTAGPEPVLSGTVHERHWTASDIVSASSKAGFEVIAQVGAGVDGVDGTISELEHRKVLHFLVRS